MWLQREHSWRTPPTDPNSTPYFIVFDGARRVSVSKLKKRFKMYIVSLYASLVISFDLLFCRRRSVLFVMPPKGAKKDRRRRETVYGEVYDPTEDDKPLPEPPKKTPEELAALKEKIKGTAFLKEIDEKRLTAALRHMTPKEIKAGEFLFKQGDNAEIFYIVQEGKLEVYKNEDEDTDGLGEKAGEYDPDSNPCINEIVLLYKDERQSSVKALTDAKLWEIGRPLYTRVVVKMAYERRKRHQGYLDKVPMLATLEPYEKVRLCDAVEVKKYADGEKIYSKNEEAKGIFFIEEGEAELDKDGTKKPLKPGDYFGERALLIKEKRKDSATAKKDCEVAFLETAAFERLIGKLKTLLKRKPDVFKKVCADELGTAEPDPAKLR